ncbi:MAG: tail fiber protein [Caulobacteraceae bacterium]|nr:tail fiber protein [Caulobacteraceae bacterium]
MTSPYYGEIQIFGFNYPPYQWAQCGGQLIPISQNPALFSLIGTTYGGNGTTNFQLPNLASRIPCSQGQGPGLTDRVIGETFGEMTASLTIDEVPQHTHNVEAYFLRGATNRVSTPQAGYPLTSPTLADTLLPNTAPNVNFAANAVGTAGNSTSHNNIQPVLALNYCIALYGDFPSFS